MIPCRTERWRWCCVFKLLDDRKRNFSFMTLPVWLSSMSRAFKFDFQSGSLKCSQEFNYEILQLPLERNAITSSRCNGRGETAASLYLWNPFWLFLCLLLSIFPIKPSRVCFKQNTKSANFHIWNSPFATFFTPTGAGIVLFMRRNNARGGKTFFVLLVCVLCHEQGESF